MKLWPVTVAFCLVFTLGPAFADDPALVDVRVEQIGERFLVSGRLEGGLSPNLSEEISAGIETTILYRLHLHLRRDGLPDPVITKLKVFCTVRRDALTRQYTLTRRIDEEVDETRVTGDEEEMRTFITSMEAVPIARHDDLSADGEYYLKAKARVGMMWRWYLLPWPLDTDWVRVGLDMTQSGPGDQDS